MTRSVRRIAEKQGAATSCVMERLRVMACPLNLGKATRNLARDAWAVARSCASRAAKCEVAFTARKGLHVSASPYSAPKFKSDLRSSLEAGMAKSSFVSFHYQRDHWRVQQILNMGALDQQVELPTQEWEEVRRKGDDAVHAWIDQEMNYKQAVVVLIGNQTASREFVQYEIRRAWSIRKPMLGIRIHGLKDASRSIDGAGANPFAKFRFTDSSKTYADYIPVFDPKDYTGLFAPGSPEIYGAIKDNIATWAASGYKRP
jgi:MTH538 TIR-like domain (DUF1863)